MSERPLNNRDPKDGHGQRNQEQSPQKSQSSEKQLRRNAEIDFNSAINFLFMSLRFVEKAIGRHPRFQFRSAMWVSPDAGSRRIRREIFLIRVAKKTSPR